MYQEYLTVSRFHVNKLKHMHFVFACVCSCTCVQPRLTIIISGFGCSSLTKDHYDALKH